MKLLDIFELIIRNAFGVAQQFIIKIKDHLLEQEKFDLLEKLQFIGIRRAEAVTADFDFIVFDKKRNGLVAGVFLVIINDVFGIDIFQADIPVTRWIGPPQLVIIFGFKIGNQQQLIERFCLHDFQSHPPQYLHVVHLMLRE